MVRKSSVKIEIHNRHLLYNNSYTPATSGNIEAGPEKYVTHYF